MKDVLSLYRAREIRPFPTKVFGMADIAKAYLFFSSPNRIGKIVVSLEDPQTSIPVCSPFCSYIHGEVSFALYDNSTP